jgi:phosphoglycolate phosphatase
MQRFNVSAVAFDLDGTLLETGPDLAAAANRMLAELRLPPQSQETLISFIGHGVPHLVRRALKSASGGEPDSAQIERATASFRAHYRENLCVTSRPYPGVFECLHWLRARGLRRACITNKSAEFAQPLLEQTGLAQEIELLIGGDTLPNKKPHPQPLLHAASHFGISASQLLLVGDSGVDVQAARAAGASIALVSYGYSGETPAQALGADRVLDRLDELIEFLQQCRP